MDPAHPNSGELNDAFMKQFKADAENLKKVKDFLGNTADAQEKVFNGEIQGAYDDAVKETNMAAAITAVASKATEKAQWDKVAKAVTDFIAAEKLDDTAQQFLLIVEGLAAVQPVNKKAVITLPAHGKATFDKVKFTDDQPKELKQFTDLITKRMVFMTFAKTFKPDSTPAPTVTPEQTAVAAAFNATGDTNIRKILAADVKPAEIDLMTAADHTIKGKYTIAKDTEKFCGATGVVTDDAKTLFDSSSNALKIEGSTHPKATGLTAMCKNGTDASTQDDGSRAAQGLVSMDTAVMKALNDATVLNGQLHSVKYSGAMDGDNLVIEFTALAKTPLPKTVTSDLTKVQTAIGVTKDSS